MRFSAFLLTLLSLLGCTTANPYSSSTRSDRARFKKVPFPFKHSTAFYISQGPFGKASHSELGNEYSWDFDVPYGTEVFAVESGKVIEVWSPDKEGGCDPMFLAGAHNIKIEAADGSVAQYVHIDTKVNLGQIVKEGDLVAVTAKNGYICAPQLHFGIYKSRSDLYISPTRKTLPLLFEGLPGGIAKEGLQFIVN